MKRLFLIICLVFLVTASGHGGTSYTVMKDTSNVVAGTVDFTGRASFDEMHFLNVYQVDASEADHSVNSSSYSASDETTWKTINDFMDGIGTTEKATLLFVHNGTTTTTDYAVTNDIDLRTYTNFMFLFQHGAMWDVTSGKSIQLDSSAQIIARPTQQIVKSTGTSPILFSDASLIYGDWWGMVGDGLTATATANYTALNQAFQSLNHDIGGELNLPNGEYYISDTFHIKHKSCSDTVSLSVDDFALTGMGRRFPGQSTTQQSALRIDADAYCIQYGDGDNCGTHSCSLRNIYLGRGDTTTAYILNLNRVNNFFMSEVGVQNGGDALNQSILSGQIIRSRFENVTTGGGVNLNGTVNATMWDGASIGGSSPEMNGFFVKAGRNISLKNVDMRGYIQFGDSAAGQCVGVVVENIYWEDGGFDTVQVNRQINMSNVQSFEVRSSGGTHVNQLVNGTNWRWDPTGDTGEYYLATAAGGSPGWNKVDRLYYNTGTALTAGTKGSLSAGEFAWGDGGGGFNTVIVRIPDDDDPDDEATGYLYSLGTRFFISSSYSAVGGVITLPNHGDSEYTVDWQNMERVHLLNNMGKPTTNYLGNGNVDHNASGQRHVRQSTSAVLNGRGAEVANEKGNAGYLVQATDVYYAIDGKTYFAEAVASEAWNLTAATSILYSKVALLIDANKTRTFVEGPESATLGNARLPVRSNATAVLGIAEIGPGYAGGEVTGNIYDIVGQYPGD